MRKPTSNVVPLSSRFLAVMKGRTIAWSEPIQHKVNMTDLEHSRTRFDTALIVLNVASIPPVPRVGALNDPALLQRREAFHPCGTRLYLDAPPGPVLGHPGLQSLVVILLSRTDRYKVWKVLGRDEAEKERSRHAIVEPRTGHEDRQYQAQRIDQQMPLTPFDVLGPLIPTLRAPSLGGLHRLIVDARGTGGGLASHGHARAFAQGLDHCGPSPVGTPLRTGVIDRALGQHIMRQHVPLAPAPVEIDNRVEDFPHVDRTWVPAAWARLGRWDQRLHDGPLVVRQIRWILLSRTVFLRRSRALLS